MSVKYSSNWLDGLDESDLEFVRRFILNSGSLKKLSKEYEVSYPTIRSRLNQLISKIKLVEEKQSEPMIKFIKSLAIEDKVSLETANLIIKKYKDERNFQ
ncbi:DUF2089 family protein [Staphylococcus pseudintermedius]|uniref:DUF2089 family protein n=1 Tax=Staphylococcus pseudintermedius TaxID=283734 RepID=A0A3D8ZBX9_STAPS|nr:DUF2089 family protein [Staphylococcus pseudintermedius]ALI97664.1 hypothetical protein ABB38_a12 [Staphylococcus pseudintermedius]EGQ1590616.1 DUF2089 domain-containing protein [Staphylococcus pseudintermedius]EGQ1679094.1 DUF2089 family protein [Staphylococcus pseudintermedius]EGQ2729945.1 DUF2089 domain-containing protein [Staphylococcus pseudintermedius]EGQ2932337.1 DUF2089 family protein [Staphylococcus pseudintermedius]